MILDRVLGLENLAIPHERRLHSFAQCSVFILFCLGISVPLVSWSQGYGPLPTPDTRADRLLLMTKPDVTADQIEHFETMFDVRIHRDFKKMEGLAILEAEIGRDLNELTRSCTACGLIEWAEPDPILHASLTPNDPAFSNGSAWGLRNTGIQGGKRGADIDAESAWDVSVTARDVIVAIIDSGIRYTHEDLSNNM